MLSDIGSADNCFTSISSYVDSGGVLAACITSLLVFPFFNTDMVMISKAAEVNIAMNRAAEITDIGKRHSRASWEKCTQLPIIKIIIMHDDSMQFDVSYYNIQACCVLGITIVMGSEYGPFPSILTACTLTDRPDSVAIIEQWDDELVLNECLHTPSLQEVFEINISELHFLPERWSM